MITDPRSIPNAKIARLIWAIAIAVLAFVFRNVFYNADAMFYALFLTIHVFPDFQDLRFHNVQSMLLSQYVLVN